MKSFEHLKKLLQDGTEKITVDSKVISELLAGYELGSVAIDEMVSYEQRIEELSDLLFELLTRDKEVVLKILKVIRPGTSFSDS